MSATSPANKVRFPLYVVSDEGIIYLVDSVAILESQYESHDFGLGGIHVYDNLFRRVVVQESLRFVQGNFTLSLDTNATWEQSILQLKTSCVNIAEGRTVCDRMGILEKDLLSLIDFLRQQGLVKTMIFLQIQ